MVRKIYYQKGLMKIIENLKKENPRFYVGLSNVGEVCMIDNCGKDATHKIGEEISNDDPYPDRHNLTNYVCCEHYQKIMGDPAKEQCASLNHELYYFEIDTSLLFP